MFDTPSGVAYEPSSTENLKDPSHIPENTTENDINEISQSLLLAKAPGAEDLYERQQSRIEQVESRYNQGCQNTKDHSVSCRADIRTEIPGEAVKILEQAKGKLYEVLHISESDGKEGFTGFKKGFVDGLIGENIDLAKELLVKGVDGLAEALSKILESAESVKNFIESLGESVMNDIKNLTDPNGYKAGSLVGTYTIGIGGIMKGLGKGVVKGVAKEGEKVAEKTALHKTEAEALRKAFGDMSEYAEQLSKRGIPKNPEELKVILDEIKAKCYRRLQNIWKKSKK